MKTLNPFVPTVSLIVVPPRSRRERFKAGVITVLLAHAIVLIGLLIQGCRTESSAAVGADSSLAGTAGAVAEQGATGQAVPDAVPAHQPSVQAAGVSSQASSAAQMAPAQASATRSPSTAPSMKADTFYVIKPGDTLARIARAHGTTVKAIKLANGISSDALSVGQKLKIPAKA